MNNSTKLDEVSRELIQRFWFSDVVNASLCSVMLLYITLSISFYWIKADKSPIQEFHEFMNLSPERRYRLISKYICLLFTLCLQIGTSIITAVIILAINVIYYEQADEQNIADTVCNVLFRLSAAGYVYCIHVLILFLWTRQKVFYTHALLIMLSSRPARLFSNFVLITFTIVWFFASVAYLSTNQIRFFEDKCIDENKTLNFSLGGTKIILVLFIVKNLTQLLLLGLLIHCILIIQKNQQQYQQIALLKQAKKAAILTSMFLMNELLCFLIASNLYANFNFIFTSPYFYNSVINNLSLIWSFEYWKKLLFPWKMKFHSNTFSIRMETNTSCSTNHLVENKKITQFNRQRERQFPTETCLENHTSIREPWSRAV